MRPSVKAVQSVPVEVEKLPTVSFKGMGTRRRWEREKPADGAPGVLGDLRELSPETYTFEITINVAALAAGIAHRAAYNKHGRATLCSRSIQVAIRSRSHD